jgi:hypothetical protein
MGCSCRKTNARRSSVNGRTFRPAAALTDNNANASAQQAGLRSLQGSNVSPATNQSRKRIEKLRREAIRRRFGK